VPHNPEGGKEPLADLAFEAKAIDWRGPAPYLFVPVPEEPAAAIKYAAALVTYGWGMVPVNASVDGVEFTTALFPKDGTFLLPLKRDVQRKTGVGVGDIVRVQIKISAL
jgi:Domain of unknown function (DUF1905)